jgi:polyhydroxybutyrate depolymerase
VAPDDATLLAQRSYDVQLPQGYDDTKEWPLVIALHGYGEKGTEMQQRFHLGSYGRYEGAALYVAPNAMNDSQHHPAWHPDQLHRAPWDVEYLTAVIKEVSANYRVDPRRITFIGFSQGAHMAHRMACDASEYVSGIVSIAGQVTKQASGCAPPEHVSVLQVHGTNDEAIGYNGDVNVPADPTVPSAHETIGVWARNDGCTGALKATGATLDLDTSVPGEETTVDAYEGCPAGIGVELWTVKEGTHGFPVSDDFAARLYGFLQAHPRP